MVFDDIRYEIEEILVHRPNEFLLAYQIAKIIEKNNPQLWQKIINNYSEISDKDNNSVCLAISFISNALRYFTANSLIENLYQENFSTIDLSSFDSIQMGSQHVQDIWCYRLKPINLKNIMLSSIDKFILSDSQKEDATLFISKKIIEEVNKTFCSNHQLFIKRNTDFVIKYSYNENNSIYFHISKEKNRKDDLVVYLSEGFLSELKNINCEYIFQKKNGYRKNLTAPTQESLVFQYNCQQYINNYVENLVGMLCKISIS